MATYVSTGGMRDRTCIETALKLLSWGFRHIELSGGLKVDRIEGQLESLIDKGASLTLHNYLPLTHDKFVLNLASSQGDVAQRSIEHVRRAIELSSAIGSQYYAVHAGFLIDPRPSELGASISVTELTNRAWAKEAFIDRVSELAVYARTHAVNLLIENNVLSDTNYRRFGENPLLMCAAEEIQEIFDKLPSCVGLLLDVAHLKVSANTLGLQAEKELEGVKKLISGLHLSDNNGLEDQNKVLSRDSWFSGLLNRQDYQVLEVYEYQCKILSEQLEVLETCLR